MSATKGILAKKLYHANEHNVILILMSDIESLLLTHQQMEETYQKFHIDGKPDPYFYEIAGKDSRILFYIGVQHILDPKNPQNQFIKEKWNEFLERTKGRNRIALNEGGNGVRVTDESSAITQFGEVGLLVWLANQSNVDVYSPEPDRKKELEELEKRFSREDIAYYYLARSVDYWHKFQIKPDLEEYMEKYFAMYRDLTNWEGFEFSMKKLEKLHNQRHNHSFDPENKQCFYESSAPSKNPVASASSHIRDASVVREIEALWNQDKCIFIIFGSGHFITQRPALEALLK